MIECCERYCSITRPYYYLTNNTWGAPDSESMTQCIYVLDDGKLGFRWNRPNATTYTYPHIRVGLNRGNPYWDVYPKRVNEFTKYEFTVIYRYPQLPSGGWNFAPEIWLAETTDRWIYYAKAEIMFFLDHSSINPIPGTYMSIVNDGYRDYKLYYRWNVYSGSPYGGWKLFSFVRGGIGNTTQGPHIYTVNIKRLLDYLSTNNLPDGTKMINSNYWAPGLEIGAETFNKTSGKIEFNILDININNNVLNLIPLGECPDPISSITIK